MAAATLATALSLISFFALRSADMTSAGSGATTASPSTSPLAELADSHPGRPVEVIVQLQPGTGQAEGAALVRAAGGTGLHPLPIINGFGTTMTAANAQRSEERRVGEECRARMASLRSKKSKNIRS